MRFEQFGRTFQLRIASAEDLRAVLELDQSRWMATSAPTSAFRTDPVFLGCLDADGDGRIAGDCVKEAIGWLLDRLQDPSQVAGRCDTLPLAAIRDDTPDGRALLHSVRYILGTGKDSPGDQTICLAQVRAFLATIQSRPLNGDGVIVPEAAEHPEVAQFLHDVVAATGGEPDASGRQGATEAQVKQFLDAIPAYLAWRERAQPDAPADLCEVLPFGLETPGLHQLLYRHADAVDRLFDLCRLAEFDPRTSSRLPGPEGRLQDLDPAGPGEIEAYLRTLPVAMPRKAGGLPLAEDKINPLYRDWLGQLADRLLGRVLGKVGPELSAADWDRVKSAFAPYETYLETKTGAFLDAVPLERLQHHTESICADRAAKLIRRDREVAGILKGAREVERLLLYHAHLLPFANNFVSFPLLYSCTDTALFERGSLVMDGRWFTFAVQVEDRAAHSAVAKHGNLLVIYVEITGAGAETFTVALPVTSGTKGNITLGKRGVFFDVAGRQHDARVVQVIDNPVSLREALCVPFIRLWQMIEGKIETWSGTAEKDFLSQAQKLPAEATVRGPETAPAATSSPGLQGGTFIGIGVVTAALGSAFAFITKTFSELALHQVLWGLAAALAAVMLPITLVASLKLRRQDLSCLLEGAGWAINARMRLNRHQRNHFTRVAPFPADAEGTPRHTWLRLLVWTAVALLALWTALQAFIAG